MNDLVRRRRALPDAHQLLPAEPLWQRAPARDAQGRPVADFMMLIPGLAARPEHERRLAFGRLSGVLERYREVVVFADVNVRLNVLWVSLDGPPGLCAEVSAAIRAVLPEARLVAQPQSFAEPRGSGGGAGRLARTRRWLARRRLGPRRDPAPSEEG